MKSAAERIREETGTRQSHRKRRKSLSVFRRMDIWMKKSLGNISGDRLEGGAQIARSSRKFSRI